MKDYLVKTQVHKDMIDCSFRNEFKSFWLALYKKRSLVQWVEIISKGELLHLQFDKIIYMYNIRPSYLSNYNLKIVEINLWKNRCIEEVGKLLQKIFYPIVPLVLNELVSRLMQKSAPQNMTTINECVAWLISED